MSETNTPSLPPFEGEVTPLIRALARALNIESVDSAMNEGDLHLAARLAQHIDTPAPAPADDRTDGQALAAILAQTVGMGDKVLAAHKAILAAGFTRSPQPAPSVSRERLDILRERITDPAWRSASTVAQIEGILHALDLRAVRP